MYDLLVRVPIATLLATTLAAQTSQTAVDQGWYLDDGFHFTTNQNYLCGETLGVDFYRNFFVFDTSAVTALPVAGTLKLFLPNGGFVSADDSEQYTLFEVTTPVQTLVDGTGGVAVYDDLGTGPTLGTVTIRAEDAGETIEVDLNATALSLIESTNGLLAFGGSITTLDAGSGDEYAFGATGPVLAELELMYDPTADFDATPTSGAWPLDVAFTDRSLSTGISSWLWDFGDGSTSTASDPTHTYSSPGTFSVRLTVTNANGTDSLLKSDYVQVDNGGVARATTRNGNGTNPLVYTNSTLPILGTLFVSQIDAGAVGSSGLTFVFGFSGPLAPIPTFAGELLIDTTTPLVFLDTGAAIGGISDHSMPVPNDTSLLDLLIYTQGFVNVPPTLTNAIDLALGF